MGTYYIGGTGRFSFDLDDNELRNLANVPLDRVDGVIRQSASGLVSVTKTQAPKRTGQLREGIIPSPFAERSATPGKVVYDVYFDEAKNNIFQKAKKGKGHYYYPASQEYGFLTRNGKQRVEGLHFMRNTAVAYYPAVEAQVAQALDQTLEEL